MHGAVTLHGLPFQVIALRLPSKYRGPMTRCRRNGNGLGSSPFARHYWGNHILFSSPAGNEMFQFPRSLACYCMTGIYQPGCPIPEIHGSRVTCTSPWPIAAYRVLHRLREPRHPPRALNCSRSLASCY